MKHIDIHIFGASTAVGESLRRTCNSSNFIRNIYSYSRFPSKYTSDFYYADFNASATFYPAGDAVGSNIWVSFAPIWKFAPFFYRLSLISPHRLHGLSGLIACSSSSVITKRFATNSFDKTLVSKLSTAEQQLLSACNRLEIPCSILQPTLIYGKVGDYGDKNLSRLLHIIRRLPFLPLPSQTGLRQPIHASQLASLSLQLAYHISSSPLAAPSSEIIPVGGDTTLTYTDMIMQLMLANPSSDSLSYCHLLPIPNRLFFLLSAPLLLRSPKTFEAVYRMGADLSGFTPVHKFLGTAPQPFPVLPIA